MCIITRVKRDGASTHFAFVTFRVVVFFLLQIELRRARTLRGS